jgi:NitT/TauT family transport system ATP-binding protein
MKLISGLRMPPGGYVYVDGRQVGGPLKIVGMAFQNANLLPWRTTLDNVMLPLEIVEPYRSTLKKERGRGAPAARRGPGRLRGQVPVGAVRRHAAAGVDLPRADPPARLLMLDEPFGALDAFTREELWCMLRDLWQLQPSRHPRHPRPARGGLPGRHRLRDEQAPGRILVRREIDLPRPATWT